MYSRRSYFFVFFANEKIFYFFGIFGFSYVGVYMEAKKRYHDN